MKAKIVEKQAITDKDAAKNQPKTAVKVTSPKNTLAKGLMGWKSQKDLHRILNKNSQKSDNQNNQSISSEVPENNYTLDKKNSKQSKELHTKIDLKNVNSPKVVSDAISTKTQNTRFFRSKNSLPQKQDENTRKLMQQKEEKQEKLVLLQRRVVELDSQVNTLNEEKERTNQIILQIKNQKEVLEKNLERLKNVANENKKLLREKAEGFNNNGSQIMALKAQLNQLILAKRSSSSIGINTENPPQTGTIIQASNNRQDAGCQKAANSSEDLMKTFQLESIAKEHSIANKNPNLSQYLQILHNLLNPLQERLYFYEETIYQQQKQLNEFYDSKQITPTARPNTEASQQLLHSYKINQQLRQKLERKQRQCNQLREDLWSKDRQIQNFRLQTKVKEVYNRFNQVITNEKEQKNNSAEIMRLRGQVDEMKEILGERQCTIKQMESKISQQQLIIRSLYEKKNKQFIK